MKKLRLKDLGDINKGHFLSNFIPGKYINKGKVNYGIPGERTHSNDGPDGKDYHVHDDHEVFVFFQGKAVMEVNNKNYDLVTGDILIIEPGDDHHLVIDSENPSVYYWFHAGNKPHWEMD